MAPYMPSRVRTEPTSCDTALNVAALLGRASISLDPDTVRHIISGRRILVTGAGGSIGGALAHRIAALDPAQLALLDNGEYGLWRTGQDITDAVPSTRVETFLTDIRDIVPLLNVVNTLRPDVIFHTAALKHVPIVEKHPIEGLLTNAIGTRHLADAARAAGVHTMILVSTDKAVAPTSIMGASKRLAETYIQALDIAAARRREQPFRCISLRCGNVLGSSGSVMELFQRQIARGGPITLTHPDMRRYIMTSEEAVRLLLTAARLGASGTLTRGSILVPEMGEPIRILDLAQLMIAAAPGAEVTIQFTNPRPGEKLSEQAWLETDLPSSTSEPTLMAISPHVPELPLLVRAFDELESICHSRDTHLALTLVSRLIPGFVPRPAASPEAADRLSA